MKVGDRRYGGVDITSSELNTELEAEQTVEENLSESGSSSHGRKLSSNKPESSSSLADKDRALRFAVWDRFRVLLLFVPVLASSVVEWTKMIGTCSSVTELWSPVDGDD